jgi:acyl-CoA synthetase (AMP-forming)/AMP-acid ligase II
LIQEDQSWSWSEIDARVDAMVAALRAKGVGKGDRILVQSRNTLQLFETCWVAFRLGCVWVPTNFRLTPPEVAYLGSSSGARVMVYEAAFAGHVDAVRQASGHLEHVVCIGTPRDNEYSYEELVFRHGNAKKWEEAVSHEDPLWFLYLGNHGTTQSGCAYPRANGVRCHQSLGRPDPRNERRRLLDCSRASVSRGGHTRPVERRQRSADGSAAQ